MVGWQQGDGHRAGRELERVRLVLGQCMLNGMSARKVGRECRRERRAQAREVGLARTSWRSRPAYSGRPLSASRMFSSSLRDVAVQ